VSRPHRPRRRTRRSGGTAARVGAARRSLLAGGDPRLTVP
jgi:hypothetical protein